MRESKFAADFTTICAACRKKLECRVVDGENNIICGHCKHVNVVGITLV